MGDMRHWIARLALLAPVLVFGAWVAWSGVLEQTGLHPRHSSVGPPPSANGWSYRDISFKDDAGLTLRGWWIPGTRAETIVMVHGWTSSRREPLSRSDYLHAAGYNLLVFDLRGHGQSDGNYTTLGSQEPADVRAAVSLARTESSGPIALFGYSMGGASVIEEAARDSGISAVVEDSAFDTTANLLSVYFTQRTSMPAMPFGRMMLALGQIDLHIDLGAVRPVDAAGELIHPLLAIVGGADTLVPPVEGMNIYNAARGPKQLLFIAKARHVGGYYTDRPRYERTVLGFLARYL
jgi:pimeloyl-ACP methyl ester carboxylesterase